MPEISYLVGVLLVSFAVTFALRALPFAVLEPLRESRFVLAMAIWMPVGVLAILAAVTFGDAAAGGGGHALKAVAAAAVTVVTHLVFGRRTLLSVGLGTLTYVVLVNLF